MKKNYTHLTMVIDRSGSMNSAWSDVIGGYASLVEENKKAEGEATISLYSFDCEIERNFEFVNIDNVSEKLDEKICPRGMTALRDAIGTAIQETGAKLKSMDESERPEKVIIVIQTDGLENASSEYSQDEIAKMVKEQEDKYNWEFLFVGKGKEIEDQGRIMGFAGSTVSYSVNNTENVINSIGEKLNKSRTMMARGEDVSKAMSYSNKEVEDLNN